MAIPFYQCGGCNAILSSLTPDGKLPVHGWYERRKYTPCAYVGTRKFKTYD